MLNRRVLVMVVVAVVVGLSLMMGCSGTAPAKVTTWLYSAADFQFLESQIYVNVEMPKIIEKATNGQLKIEYRPGLYSDDDRLWPLVENKIQLAWHNTSNFAANVPEWQMTHVPFLITSTEEYYNFFDGPGFDMYFNNISDKYDLNFQGLLHYSAGCDGLWSNKLVDSIDDFKGLKIAGDALSRKAIDLLGGTGMSMPYLELYVSLERGAIDGCLIGNFWGYASGFQDAVKYYAPWPFISDFPLSMIVNKDALAALPDGVRREFLDSMENVIKPRVRELIAVDQANAGPEVLSKSGVTWTDIDDAELEKAANIVEPIIAQWANTTPECMELLRTFEQVSGRRILD